jgi:hypothetical protein
MLTSAFTASGLEPVGHVLNPRSWVEILTSVDGDDVSTGIQPSKMSLHRGSHNKADEAKITVDSTAFDFPVRLIGGAVVSLYFGLVEEAHDLAKKREYERFFGAVVDYGLDTQGRISSLEAQDLSYLLRKKTYPIRKTIVTDGNGRSSTIDPTPRYSDTLEQAILRLLSIIPEFADPTLPPPLTLRKTDALQGAVLGSVVSGRAKSGTVPLKPDSTVWEGIEHLCGLFGHHVKVDLREIVVRTAEEVFAGRTSRCTFIFGGPNANANGPKFNKKPQANRNGVRVIVHDPEQRKTLTAIYPDEATQAAISRKQPRHQRAKPTRQQHSKPKASPPPPPRDVYELDPGHYTQAALDAKAKAIYLERSRQEADGSVSTPIWTEEICNLMNGDLITVKVNRDIQQQLALIGDDGAAAQFLRERMGYSQAAADALVRASRKPSRDDWYAKEITFDHPSESLATVRFINLVEI